ncbi:glutaminyl-tRNA synthase (glutamine-hydrolyzing) subunit A [Candidatus Nomurabacteria bacterium RIFCSPHIGHO2_02_FULL_33_12]|uniref:Glutamyl-tRNA(Gln) amidotransferase subunit A n=1 Tax=Candidatus Nomurabacteria bacterium RIFCSPLOWO2_01_FULL_33_17 TaxID=1801764 RepID=A0A1F6WQ94_9BACT|nr:MAG: glutaminyl-tRNA synthase (glutamine-hydrolyzing) subunit A [Candidatus Nomurabacteria bacterium RIFCSPHIGHO2_02_FULL_33_12]OGI83915.1 MAG: glutaminyl-tRNA synthase (glutamine-hydrolyzing) subunit A [Candidatus Nomurabacteria bacterium RIFCSPLOWO2_01_FULL_33_17]
MDISTLNIKELHELYINKETTVNEVVSLYMGNIIKNNEKINAYLEIFSDVADYVKLAQEKIDNGTATFLTGVPIAIKDNMLFMGHIASAGSKMLENYVAPYTSPVIQELLNQGAIILGRTNMDEFAMGSSTESSSFGNTLNPLDITRVPGGSSGGSAAAVSMYGALVSLGSDTGGSIRQPAAYCGLVGLKPTYGTVSRYGLIAMASSFDQIGPLAKNIDDAEILYNALSIPDSMDQTLVPIIKRNEYKKEFKKIIGIPRDFIKDGVDPEIMDAFNKTVSGLKDMGYEIVDIKLPLTPLSLAVYYVIQPAEVSSNLGRFDGLRFGFHPDDANLNLNDYYEKVRTGGFGLEVRRRCILGAFILSHGYYDAYYNKAIALQKAIKNEFINAFKDVDIIMLPTAPGLPFKFGEKSDSPLAMYLEDLFTAPGNIAGIPGITVPVRYNKDSLPVGVQAYASHFNEEHLFTIGRDIENLNNKNNE